MRFSSGCGSCDVRGYGFRRYGYASSEDDPIGTGVSVDIGTPQIVETVVGGDNTTVASGSNDYPNMPSGSDPYHVDSPAKPAGSTSTGIGLWALVAFAALGAIVFMRK